MITPTHVIPIIAAYLLGAVPFGFLIGLSRGVDIRAVGSRNIGATNVLRTVGKPWGALALLCDVLKGFIPAALFPPMAESFLGFDGGRGFALACACAAVAGHNWPVYLKFKGGKGIATTAGALLGVAPAALGIGLASWTVVFLLFRYVSLGSVVAAIVIPTAACFLYARDGLLIPAVLSLLGMLAIWRHRANIQRLLKGTENRIEFGKKKE